MLGEHGVKRSVQIAVIERQGFADALFEGKPAVLNGIEIWGVGRQEFLRAPGSCNELAGFGGLMEAGVVVDHELSWFQDGHQTVLDIRFKEGRVAGPLEHEGGEQVVVVERINQTHPLSALPGLLAPARVALQTPAVCTSLIIVHSRLVQIHQLLGGYSSQLRTKLLPQLLVPLGVTKGLFLCV